MARFTLAWELGGGLGHAVSLGQLARGLLQRGHHVDLVWRDPGLLAAALGPGATHPRLRCTQAPFWTGRPEQAGLNEGPRTHAELLCLGGLRDAASLTDRLAAWLGLLHTLQPDVLVTDHAPTALLAARALPHLRTAQIGTGYFQPPRQSPLPNFRFWDTRPTEPHHEAEVLAACQAAQRAHGIAPLTQLAELLHTDLDAVLNWPALHPYGPTPIPGQTAMGPLPPPDVGQAPRWPQGPAASHPRAPAGRCLAYLRASHPGADSLLHALIAAQRPTVLVLDGATAAHQARLAPHGHIHLNTGLVALALALPQADLVVCHANAGTVFASLAWGRPLLMCPGHVEQWLTAYRVCVQHAGIALQPHEVAGHGVAALHALLDDAHFRDHARAWGERHPPAQLHAHLAQLCDQVEALAQLV